MQLERMAASAIDYLIGRLFRRLLVLLIAAILLLVAIYHFEISGMLALDARYGALDAHLIMGACFVVLALIAAAMWWTMARPRATSASPALTSARELQLAMLVEAVMLGYALARKSNRPS